MTDRQKAVEVLAQALQRRASMLAWAFVSEDRKYYWRNEAAALLHHIAHVLATPLDVDASGLINRPSFSGDAIAMIEAQAAELARLRGKLSVYNDLDLCHMAQAPCEYAMRLIGEADTAKAEIARLRAAMQEQALQHLAALGQQAEALDKAVMAERDAMMNAAGEYMRQQYGNGALFNPIDRDRVVELRARSTP